MFYRKILELFALRLQGIELQLDYDLVQQFVSQTPGGVQGAAPPSLSEEDVGYYKCIEYKL